MTTIRAIRAAAALSLALSASAGSGRRPRPRPQPLLRPHAAPKATSPSPPRPRRQGSRQGPPREGRGVAGRRGEGRRRSATSRRGATHREDSRGRRHHGSPDRDGVSRPSLPADRLPLRPHRHGRHAPRGLSLRPDAARRTFRPASGRAAQAGPARSRFIWSRRRRTRSSSPRRPARRRSARSTPPSSTCAMARSPCAGSWIPRRERSYGLGTRRRPARKASAQIVSDYSDYKVVDGFPIAHHLEVIDQRREGPDPRPRGVQDQPGVDAEALREAAAGDDAGSGRAEELTPLAPGGTPDGGSESSPARRQLFLARLAVEPVAHPLDRARRARRAPPAVVDARAAPRTARSRPTRQRPATKSEVTEGRTIVSSHPLRDVERAPRPARRPGAFSSSRRFQGSREALPEEACFPAAGGSEGGAVCLAFGLDAVARRSGRSRNVRGRDDLVERRAVDLRPDQRRVGAENPAGPLGQVVLEQDRSRFVAGAIAATPDERELRCVGSCELTGEERRLAALRVSPHRKPRAGPGLRDPLRGAHRVEHRAPLALPDEIRVDAGRPQARVVRGHDDVVERHQRGQVRDRLEEFGIDRGRAGIRHARRRMSPGHDAATVPPEPAGPAR